MKRDYYSANIFAKDSVLKVLGQSNCITIVNTDKNFFSNLKELEGKLYQKYPNRTITKGYLFMASTNNPTFAAVKSSTAAEEEVVFGLALKSKAKTKMQHSPAPSHIKAALLQSALALALADVH